jgi:5-methylcytosine-specific restriction endonuclease McrA
MTIICKKCEAAQDSSEFYKNGRGYWTRECKTCKAKRQVKWRADNREHAREAQRIHMRKYYAANPEKCAESRKKYYDANTGKMRQYSRKYYWMNPEAAREAVRKSYQRNPIPRREYAKHWRLRNLERDKENDRKWRLNNPDKVKILKQQYYGRRKAWKLGNGFEKFSLKEILKRDGYKCHICGKRVAKKNLSFDHLIPLSRGGSHTKQNVAVAHLICNLKRGAGRIAAQLRLV